MVFGSCKTNNFTVEYTSNGNFVYQYKTISAS